jgi:uncharacterized protein YbjT (DUF2867 family)
VRFDFERPETFGAALQGVDRVFLIARPGDEHANRCTIPLLDEMKLHDVRHVVNLSAMGTERADHTVALWKIELHLERSGIGFTHLRPNFFAQVFSAGALLAGICSTGVIALPAADATVSFIDALDVAEVAVAALTGSEHIGRAYTLTGDRALDHAEVARMISAASGRPVRYVPLEEDAAREKLRRAGLPEDRIERLVRFYRLVRAGEASSVSPSVRETLGRPATEFEDFTQRHAALWRSSVAR